MGDNQCLGFGRYQKNRARRSGPATAAGCWYSRGSPEATCCRCCLLETRWNWGTGEQGPSMLAMLLSHCAEKATTGQRPL